MSRKKTLEEFIIESNAVHNYKYDYSKVEYINTNTKVIVICKEHGEFSIQPNIHINKKIGCPKCSKCRRLTVDIFIEKSTMKHGNIYDYSLITEFKNAHSKVNIICEKHGVFEQKINSHLNGRGCPTCGAINRKNSKTKTTEKFIEESEIIHNYKYSYNKTVYKKGYTKVIIICKIHGEFEQIPNVHRMGHGCPQCAIDKLKEKCGELSPQWRGGIYKTKDYFREFLTEWKIKSCEKYNFKCALSGGKIEAVHHVVSYTNILYEAHINVNVEIKSEIGQYSEQEIECVKYEIIKLHEFYGLGIPLNGDIHREFHKIYGYINFTKEDFIEFCKDVYNMTLQ